MFSFLVTGTQSPPFFVCNLVIKEYSKPLSVVIHFGKFKAPSVPCFLTHNEQTLDLEPFHVFLPFSRWTSKPGTWSLHISPKYKKWNVNIWFVRNSCWPSWQRFPGSLKQIQDFFFFFLPHLWSWFAFFAHNVGAIFHEMVILETNLLTHHDGLDTKSITTTKIWPFKKLHNVRIRLQEFCPNLGICCGWEISCVGSNDELAVSY